LILFHAGAHEGNWYDLRNEATVKLCKEIVDKVGAEQYFPFV
jgi:hypothetical protein